MTAFDFGFYGHCSRCAKIICDISVSLSHFPKRTCTQSMHPWNQSRVITFAFWRFVSFCFCSWSLAVIFPEPMQLTESGGNLRHPKAIPKSPLTQERRKKKRYTDDTDWNRIATVSVKANSWRRDQHDSDSLECTIKRDWGDLIPNQVLFIWNLHVDMLSRWEGVQKIGQMRLKLSCFPP